MLFDASLFLNWWPAGKKSAEQVTFDSKRFASGTKLNLMEYSQEELEINLVTNMGSDLLSDAKSKASASTTVIKSSINSPSFLAGYMDFDPMVAATRSHTSNSNRKSSWFSRSD